MKPDEIRPIVEVVNSVEVQRKIYHHRARIWIEEGISPDLFEEGMHFDKYDLTSVHFAAFVDDNLAGSARLSIHSDVDDLPDRFIYDEVELELALPLVCMNRLIVEPAFRRRGLSGLLDSARMNYAREHGCRSGLAYVERIEREQALIDLGFRVIATDIRTHRLTSNPMKVMVCGIDPR